MCTRMKDKLRVMITNISLSANLPEKTLDFFLNSNWRTFAPVTGGHPWGMTKWPLNTGWLLNAGSTVKRYYKGQYNKKSNLYTIIDHSMYNNLLKNTISFDFGRWTWMKYTWELVLVLFEFCSKWSFNGEKQWKQYKQHVKGDWECFIEVTA